MTMFRRAALSGLAWRAPASALCVLLLSACPEGYPTADAPRIEPSRMTQAQLLAALNELGAEPHQGATVDAWTADAATEILLLPKDGGAAREVAVLATRKWSDTVQAKSLLTQLELRCGTLAAPTA